MKILLIILIICLNSCSSLPIPTLEHDWPMPKKPELVNLHFFEDKDNLRYYLSREDTQQLYKDINAQKAYIKELKYLIKEMKEFYGDK